ncbi:MAG: MFS transporter [Chloroflexota bacterium]
MKAYWKPMVFIGTGFMGVTILWALYNATVPLYLQFGHPDFDTGGVDLEIERGFGRSAITAGFIMSMDNLMALWILPLVGLLSDRTRTRIGRRKPYILAGAIPAALAFLLTPAAAGLNAFWLFMLLLIVTLIGMAVVRTPLIALMPDTVPEENHGPANGLLDLMGGMGGVLAILVILPLFAFGDTVAFGVAAGVLLLATVLLLVFVREPATLTESAAMPIRFSLSTVDTTSRYSLGIAMLGLFVIFMGFGAVEAFFSSYAVTVLGISIAESGQLLSAFLLPFLFFAIPAGYVGNRIGRETAIIIGLAISVVASVAAVMTASIAVLVPFLILSGVGLALISSNTLPIILEIDRSQQQGGTFVGFYYFSTQLASVVSPILAGFVINHTGGNYRYTYVIAAVAYIVAIGLIAHLRAHKQTRQAAIRVEAT